MKKTIITTALLALTANAFSSDFTGAYVGLGLGGHFNSLKAKENKETKQLTIAGETIEEANQLNNPNTFAGSLLAGYGFDFGNNLVGSVQLEFNKSFGGGDNQATVQENQNSLEEQGGEGLENNVENEEEFLEEPEAQYVEDAQHQPLVQKSEDGSAKEEWVEKSSTPPEVTDSQPVSGYVEDISTPAQVEDYGASEYEEYEEYYPPSKESYVDNKGGVFKVRTEQTPEELGEYSEYYPDQYEESQSKKEVTLKENYSFGISYLQGYQLDNFLPYVKAGLSFTSFTKEVKQANEDAVTKTSVSSLGLDLGLGARIAINDNFKVGAEYTATYLFNGKDGIKGFNRHNLGLNAVYNF